jgi:hypothetical protein
MIIDVAMMNTGHNFHLQSLCQFVFSYTAEKVHAVEPTRRILQKELSEERSMGSHSLSAPGLQKKSSSSLASWEARV